MSYNESIYKPRYRNLSINKENELYNKCQDTLIFLYNKYYGSAINVTHTEVSSLKEKIKTGITTFSKYKKDFGHMNYLCNIGKIDEAIKYKQDNNV